MRWGWALLVVAGPGPGCAPDPAEGDSCAVYAGRPEVLGACRVDRARLAPTIEEARCEQAGEREEDCRIAWVQAHADAPPEQVSDEALLGACTTDECRFVALDWRPLPLARQVERCELLGRLADPCRVHALDRYYGARPGLDQQAADAGTLSALGWIGAEQAGLAAACGIAVDCALYGEHAPRCLAQAAQGERFQGCGAFQPAHPRNRPTIDRRSIPR